MCFGRGFHLILMHFYILYSMLWGKFSKNQVFSLKSYFFQNFDWSNLIFDQSKSCFKNSVSLYLVRLIEPVFRSIEHRVSGFFKNSSLTFSKIFFKSFFKFFSLSLRLGKAALKFFVVFFLNFCKVFLPQGRYEYFIPLFGFIFIFSCI